ncbi:internal scaffolding protein [Microviridae sp.]|nr:internal scaffolding protein [Microviridae sp.]
MFIRTPFNYDRNDASKQSAKMFPQETLAQQNFRDQCDINRIVKQYGVTGQVPVTLRTPIQEDFVAVTDYHTAMTAVRKGQESFNALPADVRYRFKNDPGRFVDFCLDPANLDEAIKLGLAPERLVDQAQPEPVLTGGESQDQ